MNEILVAVPGDDSDANIKTLYNESSNCDSETLHIPCVHNMFPLKYAGLFFYKKSLSFLGNLWGECSSWRK